MLRNLIGRFTTSKKFSDGSLLRELHRYALRYEREGYSMDIGFEQALEPGIDRLIHLETIMHWNPPHEMELLDQEVCDDILDKIDAYCLEKKMKYRYVKSNGGE